MPCLLLPAGSVPVVVRVQLMEDDHLDLRAFVKMTYRYAASLAHQTANTTLVAASASLEGEEVLSDNSEPQVSVVFRGGSKQCGESEGKWDGTEGGHTSGKEP